MVDYNWRDDLWFPARAEYVQGGYSYDEAGRLADWDTRDWWSESDDDALNRLDPWLPPHLREQRADSQIEVS